jgi:hypothetical protein
MKTEYRPIIDRVANEKIEEVFRTYFDAKLSKVSAGPWFKDPDECMRRGIAEIEQIRLMLHKDNGN